jgi:hypothetical protein
MKREVNYLALSDLFRHLERLEVLGLLSEELFKDVKKKQEEELSKYLAPYL